MQKALRVGGVYLRAIHTNNLLVGRWGQFIPTCFKCEGEGSSYQHVLNVKVRAVHINIDWDNGIKDKGIRSRLFAFAKETGYPGKTKILQIFHKNERLLEILSSKGEQGCIPKVKDLTRKRSHSRPPNTPRIHPHIVCRGGQRHHRARFSKIEQTS